jgi:hypothetical protein
VQVAGAAPALNLPGSVAEANSNALPSRARDPFVEAAEQAIEAAGTAGTAPVTEAATDPLGDSAPASGVSAPLPPAAGTTEPADGTEPADATEPARATDAAAEPAPAPAPAPATVPAQASAPEVESSTVAEEPVSETTLQVRLADLPAEPDSHERAVEEQPPARQTQRLTDKGLPKRTPQIVRQADAPVTPRTGGVDAEALRRRLGGFHRGAEKGRQDVEAEIEAGTEVGTAPDRHGAAPTARTEEKTGDTVEEARS